MTKSLNVASLAPGDGKTSIIAALTRHFQSKGKTVDCSAPDSIKALLGLSDSPPNPNPNPDILITESSDSQPDASLLVATFSRDLDPDAVKSAADALGEGFQGVIINRVPTYGARAAETELKPGLEAAGLTVLGIVLESRALYGITVDDLISRLDARYALQLESGDALVEHVMVGANVLDAEDFPAGPEYYAQRSNKAVIGRGDRPDFHWSAIDTPTRCVILTGNFEPIPYLLSKAEERQVPVAVVEKDTLDVMDALEDIFNGPALDSQAKLTAFTSLLESSPQHLPPRHSPGPQLTPPIVSLPQSCATPLPLVVPRIHFPSSPPPYTFIPAPLTRHSGRREPESIPRGAVGHPLPRRGDRRVTLGRGRSP